jgi:hypothetical protein
MVRISRVWTGCRGPNSGASQDTDHSMAAIINKVIHICSGQPNGGFIHARKPGGWQIESVDAPQMGDMPGLTANADACQFEALKTVAAMWEQGKGHRATSDLNSTEGSKKESRLKGGFLLKTKC